MREVHLFLIALECLTRLPAPKRVARTPTLLNDSARHYPAIGLAVGAVGAGVLWAGAHLWPAPVAVLLSMLVTLALTGALNEDGLARSCEALGVRVRRERALQIMKDSRIGTWGCIGLVGVLAIKAAALHGLATRDLALAWVAMPWAHAVSRMAPVALLALLPWAGDAEQARARPMAQQVTPATLGIASLWCLAATAGAAAGGWQAQHLVFALLLTILLTAAMNRWLRARIGGHTGDTLGAAQQGAEVVIHLALLAALARG